MRWLVGAGGTRSKRSTSTSSVRMKLPTSCRLARSAAEAASVRTAASRSAGSPSAITNASRSGGAMKQGMR